MAQASVARESRPADKSTRGKGRPEKPEALMVVDPEETMNAVALLDDVINAAARSKVEAMERYDDVIRTALRAKGALIRGISKHERVAA